MPITTVVFDLDGTLVDTAPDLTSALNHALAYLGRPPVDPASVRKMVGHGARRLVERGLAMTGRSTSDLVDEGVSAFLAHYRANIAAQSQPFPFVEEALDLLAARGARLAVCTNKPEKLAIALIGALGWEGRFAAVLGADSRPYRKPDPRHLLETIAAADGTPAGSAYVGDSRTDSDTALAARVPFVFVTHGYADEEPEGVPADVRIDGFEALQVALARIQGEFTRRRTLGGP
ncbi:MAG: phosphoglycolate phosphatase [Sphingomonadaceae bacterium]